MTFVCLSFRADDIEDTYIYSFSNISDLTEQTSEALSITADLGSSSWHMLGFRSDLHFDKP